MYTLFALHIHPLGIGIAAASIGLVSIYIGLVGERADLIFAPEKARGYSAFSLTKRALFFDSLLKRREDTVLFY